MNFKKRVNGSWVDIPYYIHKTATDTFTTLPITIYADGTAITSYTISGNTVQNGTPTPSNPVDVNGVGVRTENLVPPDLTRNYMALQGVIDGITRCAASTSGALYVIPASNSETYTIKVYTGDETLTILRCGFIDIATPTAGRLVTQAKEIINAKNPSLTTTNSANKPYFIFQVTGLYANEHGLADVMINTGSTAKPYEPYGYKIPISNGQQTTNIYLGSTQTVRAIKKLVLDGTENWTVSSYPNIFYTADFTDYLRELDTNLSLCSHYRTIRQVQGASFITDGVLSWYGRTNASRLYIGDVRFSTAAELQTYLGQQYAAGTPVTIWYVLATPETAVVNEPLMKIGNYADTLSDAAQIPTTEGANSITVDTTVQPSEFTATWTGWHNASVKEKSENLWNEDYTNISSDIYYKPVYVGDYEIVTVSSTVPLTSQNFANLFAFGGQQSSGASTNYNGVYSGRPMTLRPVDGYITIAYRNTNGVNPQDYDTMVNEGRTALPYEPYWK